MSKSYSKNELVVIKDLIKKNGHLTYEKTQTLVDEYIKRTGSKRARGSLYLAAWRLEKGFYDHILYVA